jgi:hypothetical protein
VKILPNDDVDILDGNQMFKFNQSTKTLRFFEEKENGQNGFVDLSDVNMFW